MAAKRTTKKANKAATPLYPNAPLAEVVYEIRFPAEPAVECRRHEFYEKVRREFPEVRLPKAEPGKPAAVHPYAFRSEDENETLMLAIDRFAYSTRSYEGFGRFCPRALKLSRQFCLHFKIRNVRRTGLRYVNLIRFAREDGVIPWRRYFTIEVTLPTVSPDDFLNVEFASESRCGAGSITTRIACAKSEDQVQELFLLDFDYARVGALKSSRLRAYLIESHDHTKQVFEGILAEDYKAVMRGEVLE